ncbi:MAG: rRNA ((2251)-2-O)-methyltransferase RlmB [Geminicoccaceae bacterium]|nr:rRNA ((2251)-2-O)-methyltransferase RlmB [Geminicoccaceae bacterium]
MTRARGPAKPEKPRQRPARRPRGGSPAPAKSPGAQSASAPSGGKRKGLWLYGRHAVAAALANPSRSCHRLLATAEGLAALGAAARRPGLEVAIVDREEIERRLGAGAVHQGVALSAAPLPRLELRRACAPEPGRNLVLLLDQVTDPHNVGAILRSAAAFEVRAVVLPARGSAELGGALAKAASTSRAPWTSWQGSATGGSPSMATPRLPSTRCRTIATWSWRSAPRAPACAAWSPIPATSPRACRSRPRSRASTSRSPAASPSTRWRGDAARPQVELGCGAAQFQRLRQRSFQALPAIRVRSRRSAVTSLRSRASASAR